MYVCKVNFPKAAYLDNYESVLLKELKYEY